MAYAQISVPHASTGASDGLRRLTVLLLAPLHAAHRRLLARQQLEALSDRLLRDAGIARDDLPELLRRG